MGEEGGPFLLLAYPASQLASCFGDATVGFSGRIPFCCCRLLCYAQQRPPEEGEWSLGSSFRQVLLSQVHRLRALVLLGRFLDMGSWAVELALSVGIFPYVLKLLQTTSSELRATLVFIWCKILALDKSCQVTGSSCLVLLKVLCQ